MSWRRVFYGIASAALAAIALWWALSGPKLREQIAYPSPDGKYRVVVYGVPRRFAMPGQGSDADGEERHKDPEPAGCGEADAQ